MVLSTMSASLAFPRAMPLARYADASVLDDEVARVFRHEWLLVGRVEQLANEGDYLAIDIVGEPLLLTRDGDGRLHCLSRLCAHRNLPLVDEGFGNASRMTCGYHLWSFRLDGSLIGAPLTNDLEGFDPLACALPELPIEEWLGFIFISLDRGIEPFAPRVAEIAEAVAPYQVGAMATIVQRDETWPINWKLGVENASESYHHTGTHATTVGPYAPPIGSWVEPGTDHWALHRTQLTRRNIEGDAVDIIELADDERAAFRCYTIFPSTVMLLWRGSCNWLSFLPEAPDRTRLLTGMLYPAEVASEPQWAELRAQIPIRFDTVNHEDRDMLARLQAVTGSQLARPGPLVPQEGVLAQLQRYLEGRMQDAS
jgi:phenylpropionate dioxygenase-like ring-hydroxylating dioxygenase large terminal subunit